MKLLGNSTAIGPREFRYRQRPLLAHMRGTGANPKDSEREDSEREDPEPDWHARDPRYPVSFHRPPAVECARSVRIVQGSIQIPSTARVEASPSGFAFWYSSVTKSMRTRFPSS